MEKTKDTIEIKEVLKTKGRKEIEFFFPDERRTIKAFSLEEAKLKLKELK